jgi:hypothetical protein
MGVGRMAASNISCAVDSLLGSTDTRFVISRC